MLDQYGNYIHIDTSIDQPIELFIPRDPHLFIPPMKPQNATSINGNQPFHLQLIDLNQFLNNRNLSVSLHFEIRPLNISLGYLFIYRFDDAPQLDSSINLIDGWSLLCPSSKLL